MKTPVSAIAVANTFLEFAKLERRQLTHMELQKHTFFAHSWHLVYKDGPLIADQIQAWKFGPVIPRMYHAFKRFGHNSIDKYGVEFNLAGCEVIVPFVSDSELRLFLGTIWNAYKTFTAARLSAMSHEIGGPWAQIYIETGTGPVQDSIIPDDVIADFYRRKVGR